VHLLVALPEHVNSGVDQKHAKNGQDPVKACDQSGADKDHDATHDEGAENSPREHAMLHALVDLKGTEEHQENKEIVDTQRLLDDIGGEILDTTGHTVPVPHRNPEGQGERDPYRAPDRRFGGRDFVRLAMENT
jgi:hypothetical protein